MAWREEKAKRCFLVLVVLWPEKRLLVVGVDSSESVTDVEKGPNLNESDRRCVPTPKRRWFTGYVRARFWVDDDFRIANAVVIIYEQRRWSECHEVSKMAPVS